MVTFQYVVSCPSIHTYFSEMPSGDHAESKSLPPKFRLHDCVYHVAFSNSVIGKAVAAMRGQIEIISLPTYTFRSKLMTTTRTSLMPVTLPTPIGCDLSSLPGTKRSKILPCSTLRGRSSLLLLRTSLLAPSF